MHATRQSSSKAAGADEGYPRWHLNSSETFLSDAFHALLAFYGRTGEPPVRNAAR